MLDRTATLDALLTATAARQPTPGGGSVAAVAGALAAATGEMVLSYSVGRKANTPDQDAQLQRVAHGLTNAREVLLRLMVDDQEAYAELTAVRKAGDPARLPEVVLACVRGPQAVAATAVAILDLCDQIVQIANPHLLSDLAVCADLAMATVRCAGHNVRVNLPSVANPADRRRLSDESAVEHARALALVQRLSPRIWSRVSG